MPENLLWVVQNLRRATIVYDHFHVIKSMNDRLDKVRWLISQAYGYRDYAYFRLKIHDLPSTQTRRAL